jgi:hypothetical protein
MIDEWINLTYEFGCKICEASLRPRSQTSLGVGVCKIRPEKFSARSRPGYRLRSRPAQLVCANLLQNRSRQIDRFANFVEISLS